MIASWSNIASIPKLRDITDSEGGNQLVGLVFYERRKEQRRPKKMINGLESEEGRGLPTSLNAEEKKIIFKCRAITPIKFQK
jgi:hypothetical protein